MTTDYRNLALECAKEAGSILYGVGPEYVVLDSEQDLTFAETFVRLAVERDRRERGEPVAWMITTDNLFVESMNGTQWLTFDVDKWRDNAARALIVTDVEPLYLGAPAEPEGWQQRIAQLEEALRFYADGEHFILADPDAWDTVSGEPPNLWEDEANTATVEDGSVARFALESAAPKKGD
jgi:hypothetical protein